MWSVLTPPTPSMASLIMAFMSSVGGNPGVLMLQALAIGGGGGATRSALLLPALSEPVQLDTLLPAPAELELVLVYRCSGVGALPR